MAIKHDCTYEEFEPPEIRRVRERLQEQLARQGIALRGRPPVWVVGASIKPVSTRTK